MAKMDKKWVLLCSTAVAAVYAAGYFTTESQASIQQQSQIAPIQASGHAADTSPSPAPTVVNQAKSKYKDGIYNGMGSNRRGSIQVAVTLKNDKITDVEISDFAMHYSESDVIGLPEEVLQIQSAQVENVSGATYSTRAFQDAVQAALNQAKNA